MDLVSLATQFEEKRRHLHRVAHRMLGSADEAEDAVQETWLRLSRADPTAVDNFGGWLTTVTARICLDMLRSRKLAHGRGGGHASRREATRADHDAELADSVATALLVVLETLAPAERVAYVLHDMFDVAFDEIARVLERSEAATRQLASRARRRVQRTDLPATPGRTGREIVDAFLAASRSGDLDTLLAVLDPNVVVRADPLAVRTAAENQRHAPKLEPEIRGAHAVATVLKGRARGATRATIDGEAGAAWAVRGVVRSAFVFTIAGDKVLSIDLIMEPDSLAELEVTLLGRSDA
jgi:RNA polymerase sigma-70 factor (ECF subfamily)